MFKLPRYLQHKKKCTCSQSANRWTAVNVLLHIVTHCERLVFKSWDCLYTWQIRVYSQTRKLNRIIFIRVRSIKDISLLLVIQTSTGFSSLTLCSRWWNWNKWELPADLKNFMCWRNKRYSVLYYLPLHLQSVWSDPLQVTNWKICSGGTLMAPSTCSSNLVFCHSSSLTTYISFTF